STRHCSSRNRKLILHRLASASKTEQNSTPFSIYTERSTRKLYIAYWQQLLVFVLRGMDDANQYGIEYTYEQLAALGSINAELNKEDVSNDELDRKESVASGLSIKQKVIVKQRSVIVYF